MPGTVTEEEDVWHWYKWFSFLLQIQSGFWLLIIIILYNAINAHYYELFDFLKYFICKTHYDIIISTIIYSVDSSHCIHMYLWSIKYQI